MSTEFTTPDVENFFDTDTRNQIILAYSERRQALGQSAVSAVADGEDAVDASGSGTAFDTIQKWIIDNCGSFCAPTYSSGDFDGDAAITTITTLATAAGKSNFQYFCETICTGTNLASWGFRYISTSGGSATSPDSTRKATGGDYPGTHLIADLQTAFSKLIVYPVDFTWDNDALANNYSAGTNEDGLGEGDAVWATAKTNAAADDNPQLDANQSPFKYTSGFLELGPSNTEQFYATWVAQENYPLYNTAKAYEINGDIDFYIYPNKGSNDVYFDYGTGYSANLYNHIGSAVSISNGDNFGALVGSITAPATTDWSVEPSLDQQTYKGWETITPKAVIIGDFTNA